MSLAGVIAVVAVFHADKTRMSLRVYDHGAGPAMQNEAAKQESVSASEKGSGVRGHLKVWALMMSVREYLAPTRRTSTALSKENEHGEHWPRRAVRIKFGQIPPCYPLLED